MEAAALVNKVTLPHVAVRSANRNQIAARGKERPLSSFLCGGCLKAWRQAPLQALKAPLSRLSEFNQSTRPKNVRRVQASAVLSGNGVSQTRLNPVIPVLHNEKVETVHNKEGLEKILEEAKDHLVVVEYGTSESDSVQQMHPALVSLAISCPDVKFALVLGDESEETELLMDEAEVKTVPHFVFYKNGVKIHEETGISEDMLTGDVLYYGDTSSQVVDIHNQADLDRLLDNSGDKLIVLDMGLKYCGPCVKVYPTVVKLARKMAGFAVFARVMGDENEWCQELLQRNKVLEVPTFIFLKDKKQQARYVGSSRGSLIGEILKLQGLCQ
ncbi:hypothetical protein KFL_004880100 [Klebsormidium nitens]|uniref:Thioredoxin domain-containing protein n=1 Tax=Klebsormidium nitens TaxID=105231 RepID=A0A1Y1IDS6_KLENI|nr:hypothetical protein KFL_004880100 [Klebsormidium nitens]|eukprot:GAQ89115.1 hypothetical protein KFL_004880100 [Klebsormidium nitens]